MEKLTDEQIIKALECCEEARLNQDCLDLKCPFATEYGCNIDAEDLRNEAADLINRLKAQNKEFDEKIIIQQGLIDYQRAEIERLQKHNEMVLENCRQYNEASDKANNQRFLEAINVVKSEAIKEFAEKFKAKINKYEYRDKDPNMKQKGQWILHEVIPKEVDKLLKEMDGD